MEEVKLFKRLTFNNVKEEKSAVVGIELECSTRFGPVKEIRTKQLQ